MKNEQQNQNDQAHRALIDALMNAAAGENLHDDGVADLSNPSSLRGRKGLLIRPSAVLAVLTDRSNFTPNERLTVSIRDVMLAGPLVRENDPAHQPAESAAPIRSDPADLQRSSTPAAGGGLGAAAGSAVSLDSGSCGIHSHEQGQPQSLGAHRELGPTIPAQWRGLEAEFPEAYREGSPQRPLGFVISIYPGENGLGHEFGCHTGSETHWQSGRVESEPPCVCRSEGRGVSAAGLWRVRLCGSPRCEESLRRLLDPDSDPAAASAVSMGAEKTQGHLRAEGASDDLHQTGIAKDQSYRCDETEQNVQAQPTAAGGGAEAAQHSETPPCTVAPTAGGSSGAAPCSAV